MLKVTDLKPGDTVKYNKKNYNLELAKGQHLIFTHNDQSEEPLILTIQKTDHAIRSLNLTMASSFEQMTRAPLGNIKGRERATTMMKYLDIFKGKKNVTNEMLQAAAKKLALPPIGKTCFYSNKVKARKYGMVIDAFLPRHHLKGCKVPRYSVQLEEQAEWFIRKYYLIRDKKTFNSFYRTFIGFCSAELTLARNNIPSKSWLKRQLDKLPQTEVILKTKGSVALKQFLRKYNKKFDIDEILSLVEFDFFSPKVLFRSKDGKEVISRIYFCIAIDAYSKAPLAVFTLEERGESADCFKAALKQAITEPLFSTRTGTLLELTGLMSTLVVDAGSAFSKEHLIHCIVDALSITYKTTEVAAPYRKPYIENLVNQIKVQFEPLLPGHYGDIRKDCDDKLTRATLTVEEYREELVNWLVDVYVNERQLGDTKSPLELWQESYERVGTFIPDDFDSRFALADELNDGRADYRKGICKHGVYYRNDELSELVGVGRTITLEYYVDPMDVSAIHVVHPKEKYLIKVEAVRPPIEQGTSLEELKAMLQFKKPERSTESCETEYSIMSDSYDKAKSVRSENPKKTRKQDTSTIKAEELTPSYLNQVVRSSHESFDDEQIPLSASGEEIEETEGNETKSTPKTTMRALKRRTKP
ncbi:hypothetical protein C9J12_27670 [Photobacterium frigidiphilum]|uniref:Integrase catalytic domain-containing protein n=1 Tax=Photobacterium frigidiphilum TaxID=264736 RepID=A0A2T3J6P7_9GAMM|nr:hypothetical protein [Photobacterium frigidiphilum]PSU44037.1 hypothetical protein C9J12_27670 [Photobacterium frigidiphilum]